MDASTMGTINLKLYNEPNKGLGRHCPHGKPLKFFNKPINCSVEKPCPPLFICNVDIVHNVSVCCPDPGNLIDLGFIFMD